MNDQESQAIEDLIAAAGAADATSAASKPNVAAATETAVKAVKTWAATRTTSVPRSGAKDKTRVAAPKDLAFKAITALVALLAAEKLEGELLASARRLLPYLKRSSGTQVANAKQPRPMGSGR